MANNVDNDFKYNSLSGIGESDYENEDLFNSEVLDSYSYDFTLTDDSVGELSKYQKDKESDIKDLEENSTEEFESVTLVDEEDPDDTLSNSEDDIASEEENLKEESEEANLSEDALISDEDISKDDINDEPTFDSSALIDDYELPIVEPSKIELSETPIDDLNKLTEYKEDKIEALDIKRLFDRVGVNVKEASDIFQKNSEMKEKIDARFEDLKKLQSEIEKTKKSQYDEINSYKEEVLSKLTEKKDEIEKRLNRLKELQTTLEKEREEFEIYKAKEKAEIEKVQNEIQASYDSRRDELSVIEDKLRKQKDALDEERNQLSLDKIQYESDKNELANNLLKFNEIVDTFTNGVDKFKKE